MLIRRRPLDHIALFTNLGRDIKTIHYFSYLCEVNSYGIRCKTEGSAAFAGSAPTSAFAWDLLSIATELCDRERIS